MLMCYNMGNLRDPAVRNSILDVAELEKYTGRLRAYPLLLDIGLPLFDWYVWFRDGKCKGLIQTGTLKIPEPRGNFVFTGDTTLSGYYFKAGDRLRFEDSKKKDLESAAALIRVRIKRNNLRVIYFHLDETLLRKYSYADLENIAGMLH
jgi:hypothetical protein